MPDHLHQTISRFFDEFCRDFLTFDGEIIARRYLSPFVAMHADGSLQHLPEPADTARYFQGFLDDYHASGCRRCGYRELEIVAVGEASALATVTWFLSGEDGRVINSWRESYLLSLGASGPRVFASIDHAG